jgi:hypothetical protein
MTAGRGPSDHDGGYFRVYDIQRGNAFRNAQSPTAVFVHWILPVSDTSLLIIRALPLHRELYYLHGKGTTMAVNPLTKQIDLIHQGNP